MIKLIYPKQKPLIRNNDDNEQVFCIIRKRWIVLTPEEWVRQNFLLYLTNVLHYPASLIAVEKQLLLTDLKKRFDIVIYDNNAKAFMLVECKEMNVQLSEPVLQQVLRYNASIHADWLVVTNGSNCMAVNVRNNQFQLANKLPSFK